MKGKRINKLEEAFSDESKTADEDSVTEEEDDEGDEEDREKKSSISRVLSNMCDHGKQSFKYLFLFILNIYFIILHT